MITGLRARLKTYEFVPTTEERNRAAVLIPIDISGDPGVILTLRSSKLAAHGGEVAWPGGREDEQDQSLLATALRESEEEIGLRPKDVEIIGELRPFISKHGLVVSPFVGLIKSKVELSLNPHELDAVFKVPLKYLLKDPRTETHIIKRHGETHRTPVYIYEGYRIWGLTAMILKELMIYGFEVDMH